MNLRPFSDQEGVRPVNRGSEREDSNLRRLLRPRRQISQKTRPRIAQVQGEINTNRRIGHKINFSFNGELI